MFSFCLVGLCRWIVDAYCAHIAFLFHSILRTFISAYALELFIDPFGVALRSKILCGIAQWVWCLSRGFERIDLHEDLVWRFLDVFCTGFDCWISGLIERWISRWVGSVTEFLFGIARGN